MAAVRLDRAPRPLLRGVGARQVLEHVGAPVEADAGDDDARLVAAFVRGHRRVDGDHDAPHGGRGVHAGGVEHRQPPERAGGIVEDLTVKLLAPQAGRPVAGCERRHDARRKVAGVVGGAPSRDGRGRRCGQGADQRRRARRGRDADPRVGAESEAHLQLVPRVGVAPRRELVAPRRVVLGAA